MNPCPTSQRLEELLSGVLDGPSINALNEHIAKCARCEAVLDQLSDDPELRGWKSAAPATSETCETGPGLVNLLREPSTADGSFHRSSALTFLAPPRRPGDLGCLGPYLVEAELGRGGMGIVLRAYDEGLQRPVALKVLRPELARDEARQRFVQEARAAAQVRHDHVVTIFSVANPGDGLPCFAMELLGSQSLAHWIRSGDRNPQRAAYFVAQAADGLAAAHAAGLVHRDIKPTNLLLDTASDRIKVSDFGLVYHTAVQAADNRLTQSGVILGTPAYMSPEQALAGTIDLRTDVYSLGATLYEALTGEVPFRGVTHLVLDKILHEDPVPPRQLNDCIPRDLETICLKAMAKEPAQRYPSAAEFAADLHRFRAGEPILARPVGALERRWRWCKRNRRVTLLSGALLGLLLLLAAGSSLAAIVIAEARDEADHKRQEAKDAQGRAEKAACEAKQAQAQAEQAALAAKQAQATAAASAQAAGAHFSLALDTIDTLVGRVQRQLEKGGTLTLRQELLATALKGLEKIAQSADKTPETDLRLVEVHERLGHLFFRLDQRVKARREFERGRDVAQTLLQDDPGNVPLRIRLASLLENLGNTALYAGDRNGAAALYDDSVREYEAVARVQPDNAEAEFSIAQLSARLGDVRYNDGNPAAAQALYEKALAVLNARKWPAALKQDIRYALAYDYSRLGMLAFAREDFRPALHHLEKAAAYRGRYLAHTPTPIAHTRFAAGWTALGDVHAVLGDRKAAEAAFRKALAALEPIHKANRDDLEMTCVLGEALAGLSFMQYLGGEPAPARLTAAKALTVLQTHRTPAFSPYGTSAISQACLTLTRIAEDEGRYADAALCMDHVLQSLRGINAAEVQARLKEYETRQAVYQAAAASGLDDPTKWPAKQGPIRAGLLRLRALMLARQGKHIPAAAAAAQLVAGPVPNAESLLGAARAYALCTATVAAQPQPLSDADRRLLEGYEAQAAGALRACLERDRACRPEICLHPDLERVRRVLMPPKDS